MASSRNQLRLTEEEHRLLVDHPEKLHMEKDGSLVAEEERVYIHYRNPSAPPKMVYLPKPNDDHGNVNPSVEELRPLPFPDRVRLVGQSLERRVEEVIADRGAAAPRLFYSEEAAYGFGHRGSDSFKIVRFPILFPEAATERPRTYLDVYDSRDGAWYEVEYPTSLIYPLLEPAYYSKRHGYLFWKVEISRRHHLLGFDLNTNRLRTILVPADFKSHIGELSFGCGCDGQIIACRREDSRTGEVTVHVYTLDRIMVHNWRLTEHSCFQPALSSATMSLSPIVGLAKGESQFLFFLHNGMTIVGFKFQHDGLVWQLVDERTLDVSPPTVAMDTNEEVARYKAISIGPKVIKMDRGQRDRAPNA